VDSDSGSTSSSACFAFRLDRAAARASREVAVGASRDLPVARALARVLGASLLLRGGVNSVSLGSAPGDVTSSSSEKDVEICARARVFTTEAAVETPDVGVASANDAFVVFTENVAADASVSSGKPLRESSRWTMAL
jgi:hypothetical protein